MATPLFPLPTDALAPLKTFLVGELTPISDADSSLLADYALALLKAADATEAEVEEEVRTQLRDFLEHNTDAFVATLFKALREKAYLTADEAVVAPDPSTSTRKRSRSPSTFQSPPKAPRLHSPPRGPPGFQPQGFQPGPYSGLPPNPQFQAGPNPTQPPPGRGPNQRPPKPCFQYHQFGMCSKGPACTFDHDPTYQGFIPPPPQVAKQLAMAGMGDRVDYGSIWQGRGPLQLGGMGMGGGGGPPGFGMPPPFGFPGGPPGGGPPPTNGGEPGQAGGAPPPHPFNPAGFPQPPFGMPFHGNGGPPGGGGGPGFQNQNGHGAGRPSRGQAFPTDASTRPPQNRNGKTLVIMAIPAPSLNVLAIQEYFGKFGAVTNVAIDQASSRALVSFGSNEEAYKAWKSEDAVFGSRFVKVLWHRPMEGQGVKGIEALEQSKALLQGSTTGGADGASPSSTTTTPAVPVQSKAEILAKQRVLESQIAQQKVLMARLTQPDLAPDEKTRLMAQFHKLSDEMKAGTGSLDLAKPTSATGTSAQGNRTATFAQPAKEIEGEATAAAAMEGVEGSGETELSQTELLQRKLEMLKAEAALIGVDPNAPATSSPASSPYNSVRGGRGRGRGAPRGAARGAFRGGYNAAYGASTPHKSMSLDFRTKSIAVVGEGLTQDPEAVGAVHRWFETIGGVDNSKVDSSDNRVVVTFKSRAMAEKALARGTNITDLSIPTSISWFNAPPAVTPASNGNAPAAPAAAPVDEDRRGGRDWDAEEDEDQRRR